MRGLQIPKERRESPELQERLFVDTYQEKGGKVEVIRCTDIHTPHLVGKPAGYLITGCIK